MIGTHPQPAALLVAAARSWRQARDLGEPAQPHLARTLPARDGAMLAPAMDSLCRSFEAALGRPLAVGEGAGFSEDETTLVALFAGGPRPDCRGPQAGSLDCALCSVRIMLDLAS